jgi:hypothetical protein
MIAVARQYDSKYELSMERITISIDKKTLDRIKAVAGKRGVSKFLSEAARRHLGQFAWQEFMAERDAKYGKPSRKLRNAIDRDMRKIFGHAPKRS